MGRKVVKAKFEEQREVFRIQPQNENQQIAIRALYDPSVKVVILDGFAGSGKSFITGSVAGDLFRRSLLDQIIVARPYVQTGRASGSKPGSSLEKLYPYVRTILDPLQKVMGRGAFDVALKDGERGDIQVQELESIRGRSFDDSCFLIIDEAQQSTPIEAESIVTRVGEGCKLVLCGDIRQKDIRGTSGLEWFIDFYQRHNIPGVAHIQFTIDDCVRSGFVRDVLSGIEADKTNDKYLKNT
jgi:phosphate starvation-inducible PhoH-like protein